MKVKTPTNFPVVLAQLGKLEETTLVAAEKGMKLGLEFTQTVATREYLNGPKPKRLGPVTGRLQQSIATSVQRSGKGVIGRIGSNVKYARYHEFGFHGAIEVRAHVRHIVTSGNRAGRFLRDREIREAPTVDSKGRKRLGKIIGLGAIIGSRRETVAEAQKRGVEFAKQQVGAHKRRIDYDGRPFIKPALIKTQVRIKDAILAEIEKTKPKP